MQNEYKKRSDLSLCKPIRLNKNTSLERKAKAKKSDIFSKPIPILFPAMAKSSRDEPEKTMGLHIFTAIFFYRMEKLDKGGFL